MLTNIAIKNIALIESIDVNFSQGLNILSGETGAGKSIIVDSLSFVLGKRADRSLIRYGESLASVTATFEDVSEHTQAVLDSYDIEKDDCLILKRSMTVDGKNTCSINGQRVTLNVLKDVASTLADIYSQHENVSALNTNYHLAIIDKYGEKTIAPLKQAHGELYAQYQDVCKKLQKYGSLTDVNKNIDLLEYQINEITQADLKQGEEEELLALRHKLNNSQTIISTLNECNNLLNGEDENVLSILSYAINALSKITAYENASEELVERLESCKIELKDIAATIVDLADNNKFDIRQYEECEARIALIRSLERKYGSSLDEINAYLQEIQAEYDFLADGESKVKEYEEEKTSLLKKLYDSAQKLSAARRKAADELSKNLLKELKELGMPSCKFAAQFAELPTIEKFTPDINGADEALFVFSANAGQPAKELAKVISGGELSRFMLAMKKIIANLDGITTMVFDEIDTGISGNTAQIVAQKTYDISKDKQVLAITHLPQLASMADSHFLIEKSTKNANTVTKLLLLDGDSRTSELARLIGGRDISDYAIPHAKELLEYAEKYKLGK